MERFFPLIVALQDPRGNESAYRFQLKYRTESNNLRVIYTLYLFFVTVSFQYGFILAGTEARSPRTGKKH